MAADWCPENVLVWQKEQAEIRALAPIEENRKLKKQLQEIMFFINRLALADRYTWEKDGTDIFEAFRADAVKIIKEYY